MTGPRFCLVFCLMSITQHSIAEEETVDVQLLHTVISGLEVDRAVSAARPMLNFLGDIVEREFTLDVQKPLRNKTAIEELSIFGRKLNRGKPEFGAVWGLEFGWLADEYPELKPLVVFDLGGELRTRLLLRESLNVRSIVELKGHSLVLHARTSMIDLNFLESELKRNELVNVSEFFQLKRCQTPKDALAMVQKGEADCTIIDSNTQIRFDRNFPKALADLDVLLESRQYPPPVIIGNPNRVGIKLWNRIQNELVAKGNPQIAHAARFWRFNGILKPTPAFDKSVIEAKRHHKL